MNIYSFRSQVQKNFTNFRSQVEITISEHWKKLLVIAIQSSTQTAPKSCKISTWERQGLPRDLEGEDEHEHEVLVGGGGSARSAEGRPGQERSSPWWSPSPLDGGRFLTRGGAWLGDEALVQATCRHRRREELVVAVVRDPRNVAIYLHGSGGSGCVGEVRSGLPRRWGGGSRDGRRRQVAGGAAM